MPHITLLSKSNPLYAQLRHMGSFEHSDIQRITLPREESDNPAFYLHLTDSSHLTFNSRAQKFIISRHDESTQLKSVCHYTYRDDDTTYHVYFDTHSRIICASVVSPNRVTMTYPGQTAPFLENIRLDLSNAKKILEAILNERAKIKSEILKEVDELQSEIEQNLKAPFQTEDIADERLNTVIERINLLNSFDFKSTLPHKHYRVVLIESYKAAKNLKENLESKEDADTLPSTQLTHFIDDDSIIADIFSADETEYTVTLCDAQVEISEVDRGLVEEDGSRAIPTREPDEPRAELSPLLEYMRKIEILEQTLKEITEELNEQNIDTEQFCNRLSQYLKDISELRIDLLRFTPNKKSKKQLKKYKELHWSVWYLKSAEELINDMLQKSHIELITESLGFMTEYMSLASIVDKVFDAILRQEASGIKLDISKIGDFYHKLPNIPEYSCYSETLQRLRTAQKIEKFINTTLSNEVWYHNAAVQLSIGIPSRRVFTDEIDKEIYHGDLATLILCFEYFTGMQKESDIKILSNKSLNQHNFKKPFYIYPEFGNEDLVVKLTKRINEEAQSAQDDTRSLYPSAWFYVFQGLEGREARITEKENDVIFNVCYLIDKITSLPQNSVFLVGLIQAQNVLLNRAWHCIQLGTLAHAQFSFRAALKTFYLVHPALLENSGNFNQNVIRLVEQYIKLLKEFNDALKEFQNDINVPERLEQRLRTLSIIKTITLGLRQEFLSLFSRYFEEHNAFYQEKFTEISRMVEET